jgi:MurNAc alpha-1-phosphate uridylyltransferase
VSGLSASKLQVVILAGGLGTRLRPITETVPKPMVPVAGQPFLRWQLEDLKLQGYTRVLLLVAYLGEVVEKHFGDGHALGLEIQYAYEPEPLGTGGALKNGLAKLENDFILLNGDSFLRAPLDKLTQEYRAGGFDAVVSVYDNHDPVPVIPNIRVQGAKVTGYEKDAGLGKGFDQIDSGIYVLNRELVENGPDGKFMLADLWPTLISQGKLGAASVRERFYDIGTIERLKEFEEKVRDYFPHSASH